MNVFEKVRLVKEVVKDVFPKMSSEELKNVLQSLANNWPGNNRSGRTYSPILHYLVEITQGSTTR